jgi:hypothetical protein
MARAYSAAYKSTLAGTSAPEAPLIMLEINHAALPSPVRVVNDTQDITSNGNVYLACPFRCELPDDFEGQAPRARLAVDNVGRDLMYWIETSGGGQGSTVKFIQVMRSRPNQIEWSITMNLYNVVANFKEVSGDLGFDNLFGRPSIAMTYRPDTAPGCF